MSKGAVLIDAQDDPQLPWRATANVFLDDIHSRLTDRSLDVSFAMSELLKGLDNIRAGALHPEWCNFAKEDCAKHRLRHLLHLDPLTQRSSARPRGYPGDAELLDLIYDSRGVDRIVTELGRDIYRFNYDLPAPQSVRARRDHLARKIDEIASEIPDTRILSMACGHLREAALSRAIVERRVSEIIAVDSDVETLSVVEKDLDELNVIPVHGSVRAILSGKLQWSGMHFVYSAGLFDYLSDPTGRRLAARLFSMLAPGGTLLIANFAPHPQGAGYTEAFMDWWLLHRDEAAVDALLADFPSSNISARQTYRDQLGNIVYLEVVRA